MTTNEQKMCGFVGLFDIRQKSDALRTQVLKMSKNIRHRGPDWSGVYCGEYRDDVSQMLIHYY